MQIFTASMADIEKTLQVHQHTDFRSKLPAHYHEFLLVFDQKTVDTLSSHRKKEIDHKIELTSLKRKQPELS